MESFSSIIDLSGKKKSQGGSPEKGVISKKEETTPEGKSQETLRASLQQRFDSLTAHIQSQIDQYEDQLEQGYFDDKDGEEGGAGDERKRIAQKTMETGMERVEKIKGQIDSTDPLPQTNTEIEATYTYTDPQTKKSESPEHITISLESSLASYTSLYAKTGIDLPPDFESTITDIWSRNHLDIQQAIEQHGFNDILIIPGNIPLTTLADKMKMENGTYEYSNFKDAGGFASATSQHTDTPRIILVHKAQNLTDHPELASTRNTKGQDVDQPNTLTLPDYLIFQRAYYEETQKHLDVEGWTWLATTAGSRLVHAYWSPDGRELSLYASDLGNLSSSLGVRPSRSFF
jgi:hypothetical protein